MADSITGPYTEQMHPAYRTGIVYALESVVPYRVQVQFPDRDNVISWWLPVCVPKTQNDKFFWQPDIGEQVVCLMDEHDENGCVLGSVASTVDAPQAGLTPADYLIKFEDGTTLHYNRSTHQLQITLGTGGQASITQPSGGQIQLDSSGNVEIKAAASVSLAQGSSIASDALALVSKLVTAFNAHTHGVVPGPTPTVPWTPATVESALLKVSN